MDLVIFALDCLAFLTFWVIISGMYYLWLSHTNRVTRMVTRMNPSEEVSQETIFSMSMWRDMGDD